VQTIAYIKGKCKYASIFEAKEFVDMALVAKNLSFARGNKNLFRNLNINLSAGEILYIRGLNGSGKTTLLKILAGLIHADKGEVSWQSTAISQSEDYRASLSYLGHKDGLKLGLSVKENINIQLALSNSHPKREEISKVCKYLGLLEHALLPCHQLSAGLKRKVALGAIVLKGKPLWILDEPFTSLDNKSIEIFHEMLTQHLTNHGMVIMVSHIPMSYDMSKVIDLSVNEVH
jgi:heme exporter protein A